MTVYSDAIPERTKKSCRPNVMEPRTSVANTEKAALDYLALGWSLLPIKPGDKTPQLDLLPTDANGDRRWGAYRERPASRSEVRGWFLECPNVNLAVICGEVSGNLVVVDVDRPELATNLHLPPTVCAKTSRGSHYFYKSDSPIPSQKLPWGEIRSSGNYVVLPPSLHPSGVQYEWADYCDPISMEIAPLPDSFLVGLGSWNSGKQVEEARTNISTCFPDRSLDTGEHLESVVPTSNSGTFDSVSWVKQEKVVTEIMNLCGVRNVHIGKAFKCPLPGHEEKKPSAALYRMDDGSILMHDFHQRDGTEWYSIAEVFAAVKSGKVRKLTPGEKAAWLIRALIEAGYITSTTVMAARLPSSTTPTVKAVYQGFLYLLAVRAIYDPNQAYAAPYSWRFASAWTRKGERQCGEAIEWLITNGYLRVVSKGKTKLKASLLTLGRPRTRGEGHHEASG